MRRPLYTNTTILDKKTCRKYLSMTWPYYAGAIQWMLIGLAAFTFAYGLWRLFTEKNEAVFYAAALFFIAAVALFLAFWGWALRVKRYTAAQEKSWGGPSSERIVRFYDDHFEQESNRGTLQFKYDRITSVKKNSSMLLITMDLSYIIMRRDGFGVEGDADFIRFLERKCGENKIN